jgi:hypothetical protein
VNGCWEDYVLINQLCCSMGLTQRGGDDLLKLIQSIAERHNCVISIPTTYKCIKSCIQRVVDSTYQFSEIILPYPPELLNVQDFPSLKGPSGAVLSIMEILVEFLLTVDYEDIVLRPKILIDEHGIRTIESYPSGYQVFL